MLHQFTVCSSLKFPLCSSLSCCSVESNDTLIADLGDTPSATQPVRAILYCTISSNWIVALLIWSVPKWLNSYLLDIKLPRRLANGDGRLWLLGISHTARVDQGDMYYSHRKLVEYG